MWAAVAGVALLFFALGRFVVADGFENFGEEDWLRPRQASHASLAARAPYDPLFGHAYGPLYGDCGNAANVLAAKQTTTLLLALASFVLSFLVFRRLFGDVVALAGVALAFLTPAGIQLSVTLLPAYLVVVYLVLLLNPLGRFPREQGAEPREIVNVTTVAAALLAFAALIRADIVYLLPLVLAWAIARLVAVERRPSAWLAFGGAVLLMVGPALWILARHPEVRAFLAFWEPAERGGGGGRYTSWLRHYNETFFTYQIPAFDGLLIAAAVALFLLASGGRGRALALVRRRDAAPLLALLAVAFPLLGVAMFSRLGRPDMTEMFLFPSLVLLCPFLVAGLHVLAHRAVPVGWDRRVAPALTASLVAGLVVWNLGGLRHYRNAHNGGDLAAIARAIDARRDGGQPLLIWAEQRPPTTRGAEHYLALRFARDTVEHIASADFEHRLSEILQRMPPFQPDVIIAAGEPAARVVNRLARHYYHPVRDISPLTLTLFARATPPTFDLADEVRRGPAVPRAFATLTPDRAVEVWLLDPTMEQLSHEYLAVFLGAVGEQLDEALGWHPAAIAPERASSPVALTPPESAPLLAWVSAAPMKETPPTMRALRWTIPLPANFPPGEARLTLARTDASATVEATVDVPARRTMRLTPRDFHRPAGTMRAAGWLLWSNMELSAWVAPPTDVRRLHIEASGDPCDGIWPQMRVRIDGRTIVTVPVESRRPRWQTIPVDLRAGRPVLLEIGFVNNAANAATGEDRNLYVRRVELVD